MAELKLGMTGRALVFDGPAFCLACGRRPFAARPVKFKDTDYADKRAEGLNSILNHVHPALAWANRARFVGFTLDVPVCFRHFFAGRVIDLGLTALAVGGAVALIVLAILGKLPRKEGEMGQLLKAGLMVCVVLGGWAGLRFRSKKPLLPCAVHRESDTRVVLTYPAGTGPGSGKFR
ncbi:MAG TPA: hypothetical protein VF950_13255 [Planctomycetota bacterium]